MSASAGRISVTTAVGFALLYASAFYLPNLSTSGAYFLPSGNLFGVIVLPTLVVIAVAIALSASSWLLPQRSTRSLFATLASVFALSIFTLLAIKAVFLAAEYDWEELVPRGHNMLSSLRYVKFGAFFVAFFGMWAMRHALPRLTRILRSIGFAMAALALVKMSTLLFTAPVAAGTQPDTHITTAAGAGRRVVWVIFDETDFQRIFARQTPEGNDDPVSLPNFERLSRMAFFAENASSPASATLYSIPALLTGTPIGGAGVHIDRSTNLTLEGLDGSRVAFADATTIFGAISATGRTSSILGFYHPYCKLFALARCDSFPWPFSGSLDAALRANLPNFLSTDRSWEHVTEKSIELLPQYLVRDDALTFIHLNFPHLPADYADRSLKIRPSTNPLTEYGHNLLLADDILGRIIEVLQHQRSSHETLLVVSTDHWLRNIWYRPAVTEVTRPVPFIAWRVGDSEQVLASQPLSTVHSSAMILDYLNGSITTQADIGRWWADRKFFPSYIKR